MRLDEDTCYKALTARDERFDGLFFVGVTTTGVYCRPVCPAKTPGATRCVYFSYAAEAEKAGYRACFRCRPECAPGRSTLESVSNKVAKAWQLIEQGYLDQHSVEDLANTLSVTSRHLRRAIKHELGVGPNELAQTRRLKVAKHLLQDTHLPISMIAMASGFSSLRRFNSAFSACFHTQPQSSRVAKPEQQEGRFSLRLDYRPPLDWRYMLEYLKLRVVPSIESVIGVSYVRLVKIQDDTGWIEVTQAKDKHHLKAEISVSLISHITSIVTRLRALFDLDCQPDLINQSLARSELLRNEVNQYPGVRIPGAYEPFELAIRAILGQQISVRAASTLCARLVERFGATVRCDKEPLSAVFPTPQTLADASEQTLASLGVPEKRAKTIKLFSSAIVDRTIDLTGSSTVKETIDQMVKIPGVGPWTAGYIAMRALRAPDILLTGDLGILKALGVKRPKEAEDLSAAWSPWRAYANFHLWNMPAITPTENTES